METGSQAQPAESRDSGGGLELFWRAPSACPQEPQVRAEIERLLGRPLEKAAEAQMQVIADVRPGAARSSGPGRTPETTWTLSIRTFQNHKRGDRQLTANDCQALGDAAALIIALSIDPKAVEARASQSAMNRVQPSETRASPDAGGPEVEAADTDAEETSSDAAAASTATPDPEAEADAEAETEAFIDSFAWADESPPTEVTPVIRTDFAAEIGGLPGPGVGVAVGAGLRLGDLQLELSGSYWPSRDAELEEIGGRGGEIGLLGGAGGACYRLWTAPVLNRPFSLAPCVQVEVGRMSGRGNVSDREAGSSMWLAGVASVRSSWQVISWAAVELGLGIGVPVWRPRYTITVDSSGVLETETVHRPAAVAPRLWLGVALYL